MHDGRQAVQIFYMISGFYMAMVLSSRYAMPREFYISRMMRILPPYWMTLTLTVVLCASTGLIFQQWLLLTPYVDPLANNGTAGVALTAASNLSLIGQDWIMFLSHDSGHRLHFTENFSNDKSPLWRYLLVPQCWSIGVELTFYALAPYLNRLRSRWLALIAVFALAARIFTYFCMGGARDPWTYRFFPFEISLFILGMLGYRIYLRTSPHHPPRTVRCASRFSYMLGVVVVLLLLYLHIRAVGYLGLFVGHEISIWISYLLWALCIPILFFAFGNQKDDRSIGELSYPIYLVHLIVIAVTTVVLAHFGFTRGIAACSALVSIIVSAVFYSIFIAPLERKRHNLTRTGA